MEIVTRRFNPRTGWLAPLPPALDSVHTLVIVFGPADLERSGAALADIRRSFAKAAILGCSSAGEILGDRIHDGDVCVAIVRFSDTVLRTATAQIDGPAHSSAAGAAIAEQLAAPDLRAVLVLSDGLHVNGTALLRGMNSVLPPSVLVSGGLAGDGSRFKKTWVLDGKDVGPRRKCAVGLYGDAVRLGHGSKGGWDPFGPERRVTRSHENVLFELDGRPALELYKRYLGEEAARLPLSGLLYPLALRRGDGDPIVRTILQVDEETQSLTFAGDIPEGARVQLMHANFDRLIDGAADAALSTARDPSGPSLGIAISCVGRRLVLGERVEEEVEAALRELPSEVGFIGFYSYGEISPVASGRCELHNQTMTLTHIWEAA
jgi:hypothetical protein